MKNHYSSHPIWGGFLLLLAISFISAELYGQKNKPSATLEQFRNGAFTSPVDPGTWTTGNNGSSNSHYAEAMSAPYRVLMNNMAPNSDITLVLEYDVKHSDKLALDYLTSYDRIKPHVLTFGHNQEEINPTVGTGLFQSPPESPSDLQTIPVPAVANTPVPGEPTNSFNNVAGAGQAEMAIWNGTINSINYVGGIPDLSDPSNQSQQIEINFTTGTDPSETVILSWGGHIASRNDWGSDQDGNPMSAGEISGSPYHMRLVSWNLGNLGNQDVSLSIELVSAPDVPATPENFTATSVSIEQIDLSWDPVESSVELTYSLERSPNGTNSWVEIANLPQSTTSFSDIGLEEFTAYFYRLSATNSFGTSDFTFASTSTQSLLSSVTEFNGKNRDKIGPKLTALATDPPDNPSQLIYQFDADGDVLVEVVAFKNPSTVAAVVDLLQTKYGRAGKFILDPNTYITEDQNRIDVYFEVSRLQELNSEAIVNFVRPVFRALFGSIGETGILYQGDSAQASLDARKSFKTIRIDPGTGLPDTVFLDGAGQRLGVISNSFNTQPFSGADSRYVTDQKNLDLPGPFNPNFPNPVANLEDASGESSDEGRAMLQIAHDIAPGADLAFHTGLPTLNKFEEAINDLSLAGYNLITDDVTYLIENQFGQYGSVFNAINDHLNRDSTNMYFSSAGNFADQATEGVLNFVSLPAGSNIYPDSITGYIHDFGGGDLTLDIFANPGEYILSFQWDEPFASLGDSTGAVNDLDMYVVNDSLQVEAGNNRINILGDAMELLILRSDGAKASNLVFTCECDTPPTNLKFRMIAFKISGDVPGAGLDFTDPISAPTVSGHAGFDLAKHVTVGASFYGYYGTGAGPDLEAFSSLGIPFTAMGGQNMVDITAPDGGNTNVLSIGSDIMFDNDIFNNFFGTSASAPAAAAAWALGLSAVPEWYPSGVPSTFFTDPSYATGHPVDEVTGLFLEAASPVSNQDIGGAGLLRVEDALAGVAAQTPFLSGFSIAEGQVISVDTTDVTLFGDWFTSESQVLFNGDSVPTTFVSENELMVTINPFAGDAGFVVTNTAPITESGVDGGSSNQLDLLDGRRAITIVVNDTTILFGHDFDILTFSVLGLVGDETYDSLGLPEVVINSTAVGPFPDIGNYIATASFVTPMTPEQEDEFIVTFQPGVLSINPLPLTIQPMDTVSVYGDEPVVVHQYLYDSSGISDNALLLNTLKAEHEATFLVDSAGGVVQNRFSALVDRFSALVDENPELLDDLIGLFNNTSWLATSTVIENRFSPLVNELSVIPIDADQLVDYLQDPLVGNSGGIENRFSPLVNADGMVNGQTSVFDPFENRFSPLVNRFSALVNRFSALVNVPLGGENDSTDLTQTVAIVDATDGQNTESDTVTVYSINLFSGLEVTTNSEDRHYIVSGAALSPIFTNCQIIFVPGRLTVLPRPLEVELINGPFEIDYGAPTPELTSVVTGTLAFNDSLSINYELNPSPASPDPVSAGSYEIDQMVTIVDSLGVDATGNYDITIINDSMTVNQATLVIMTEDVVITEGDDIPPAADISSNISGYVAGEAEGDVFAPDGPEFSYSSPDYEAGRIAGSFPLFTSVSPEPGNYILVDNGAQLLVNPINGQKVNIFLDCVSENKGGDVEYPFDAHFSYSNKNAVSVFVPHGPFNELTCTGCDFSQLPEEFLPGDHTFSIPFDGLEMRWQLTTFDIQNPSSVSVDGNDITGNKCKGQKIPNGRIAGDGSDVDTAPLVSDEVQFYPNPVEDRLVVRVKEGFSTGDYQLYNSQGLQYDIPVRINTSQSTAEFDFSNFDQGLYLLKLNVGDNPTIIRILRQ